MTINAHLVYTFHIKTLICFFGVSWLGLFFRLKMMKINIKTLVLKEQLYAYKITKICIIACVNFFSSLKANVVQNTSEKFFAMRK